jgi:hypothetical protein
MDFFLRLAINLRVNAIRDHSDLRTHATEGNHNWRKSEHCPVESEGEENEDKEGKWASKEKKLQCHSAEATIFTNATYRHPQAISFPCIIMEGRPSLDTSS